MDKFEVVQGQLIGPEHIELITNLIATNPHWHRTRLSKELCIRWNWVDSTNRLKDMACRSLLRKLENRGDIRLPPSRQSANNNFRGKSFQPILHDTKPIEQPLKELQPIVLHRVEKNADYFLWRTLLHYYHYLSFKTRVGKSLSYLAKDRFGRPVGCFLFGAAAWKIAPRDKFIGWTSAQRSRNLEHVVNNMRFLIPPWVKVAHLASHLISLALRQLYSDWQQKYNQPIYLVETFVDSRRFKGICYKAANWIYVGDTKGRSRNDTNNTMIVPIKAVFVFPLRSDFRNQLKAEV